MVAGNASELKCADIYDGLAWPARDPKYTIQNMTPAGTTHYLYDVAGHLLVEADDTGQSLREYVWLDDMPPAVESDVNTGSPNLYFVHADHLNTPLRMTDASKAVVWDAYFLPFGEAQSITGSATNNLRFPGQYFLIEDGLHYNWYRHYDPTIGRYTQPDPFGIMNGPSLYTYALSSPQMRIDPRGLWQITVQGAFGVRITIGNNGGQDLFNGQWNFGMYFGIGQGSSLDIDLSDSGCKASGANIGVEGSAEIGIFGYLEAEAHVFGREPWGHLSASIPGSTLKFSYGTEGISIPTFSFGQSAFLGMGGTNYYSECGCK